MFREIVALETYVDVSAYFDLRSLLTVSQSLQAKEIGSLESADPGSEKRTLGYIFEIGGDAGHQHVGDHYLVKIADHDSTGIIDIFLTQAQKLLTPPPANTSTYKTRSFREDKPEDRLDLDQSGAPIPLALCPVFEDKFRVMYAKRDADNKLRFI